MRHIPAIRLRDCQPGQTVHLRGPKGYPFVSIDGHVRLHYGERDDRTGELFGEVETICAMAEMPDGAVIKGSLLEAARKEWT